MNKNFQNLKSNLDLILIKLNKKLYVNGIIMIISCQRHKNTRLQKFKLPEKNYNNWKVIYVIGDLFLSKNYELIDDILYIKCEDSYLHLLKKVIVAIKYLNELFIIKEGILRCGDDLIFNYDSLNKFLTNNKNDYMGEGVLSCNKIIINDNWMYHYYVNHLSDFKDKNHGISHLSTNDLLHYNKRCQYPYLIGTIFYLSNKSCKVLINHMEQINYNIFHYETNVNAYQYTIEDCAIGYILNINNIDITSYNFNITHTNFER